MSTRIHEMTFHADEVRWASRRFNSVAALPKEFKDPDTWPRLAGESEALLQALRLSANMRDTVCEQIVDLCLLKLENAWSLAEIAQAQTFKGKKAVADFFWTLGSRVKHVPRETGDARNCLATRLHCLTEKKPEILAAVYDGARKILDGDLHPGWGVLKAAFHDLQCDYGYQGYISIAQSGRATVHTPNFEVRRGQRSYRGISLL